MVYEFYGCLWHGCPTCYPHREHKLPRVETTVEDAYVKLTEGQEWLINEVRGQEGQLVKIWECEFRDELERNPEMEDFVDNLELPEPLHPRDAFFGGRTNAIKLHHVVEEDEQIKYVNVCSLYPYVNKYCTYPIGHPVIIKTPDTTDVDQYEGLIKCTVLPPRGLYHPVLPYRCRGKLMFPLCATCAKMSAKEPCERRKEQRALHGTWVSCELHKAVATGIQSGVHRRGVAF